MNKKGELYKNKYRIKSTRMLGWDYSKDGYYFITICVKDRICCLGDVVNGEMRLSELGKNANDCWHNIPAHFPFVKLEDYIVMPNHVHGIIIIQKNLSKSKTQIVDLNNQQYNSGMPCSDKNNTFKRIVETQDLASLQQRTKPKNKFGPQSMNLASIIRGFKIGVKKYANNDKINFNWQPGYYDRVIRNEKELNDIRKYIRNNLRRWRWDRNNPENWKMDLNNVGRDTRSCVSTENIKKL